MQRYPVRKSTNLGVSCMQRVNVNVIVITWFVRLYYSAIRSLSSYAPQLDSTSVSFTIDRDIANHMVIQCPNICIIGGDNQSMGFIKWI